MEIKVFSALKMLGGGLAYLRDNEVSMVSKVNLKIKLSFLINSYRKHSCFRMWAFSKITLLTFTLIKKILIQNQNIQTFKLKTKNKKQNKGFV